MKTKTKFFAKAISLFLSASIVLCMFTGLFTVSAVPNSAYPVAAPTSDGNLLKNGDFSQGSGADVTGWTTTGAGILTNDGNYLNVWQGKEATQTVDLEPNTEYTVDIIAKLEYSGSDCSANVYAFDNAGNELGTIQIVSGNWNVYRLNFRTGDDALSTVIKLVAIKPNFYVRRVILLSSDNMNKVINGDAESPSDTYWKFNGGLNNYSIAQLLPYKDKNRPDLYNPAEAHANIQNGGDRLFNPWGAETVTQTLTLEPNTTYAFSAYLYIYNTANTSTIKFTDADGNILFNETGYKAQGTWKSIGGSFTTKSNPSVVLQIKTSGASGVMTYYDNIGVYKVTETVLKNGNFDYGSAFWNYNSDEATVNSENANNYFELLWGKTAKQDLTLKEYTVYKLSFDQHFNEGAANENNRLITKITSGEKELLNVEPNIGDWQTAEFIFTTESDTAATLSFTAAGANHYFDNVTIEEVSPAGEYSIVNLGVNKSNGTLEGKKVTFSNAVVGLYGDSFTFNGTVYTVKSKGVLFAADNNIPDVLDKDAAGGFVMDVDIDDTCASVNGNIYTYTFSVDNIFEETYKVAARMYLDCTDADGKTVVFYGDTIIVE